MCLFIAIPTSIGYIVGSQRDDQKERKTSTDVSFDIINKYYYVKDEQSGGTRFAYHADGVYAVLLNKSPSLPSNPLLKTRGKLPLQCMDLLYKTKNIVDVIDIISTSNLREYNSFVLAMGMIDGNKLIHKLLHWNAVKQQSIQSYHTGSLFLSASTLYTINADEQRRILSSGLYNKQDIQEFLQDKLYDALSHNCIEKKGVVTKSRTIVEYNNGIIEYDFKTNIF